MSYNISLTSKIVGLCMVFFAKGTLRFWHLVAIISVGVLLLTTYSPVLAQGNSAIAQEYQTSDENVTSASLVSIRKNDASTVELSSIEHADRLIGVVGSEPLVALSDGGSGLQVVTSGLTLALVSDISGAVASGDKITVSPIEGVGMKATEQTTIVGTAQAELDLSDAEVRTITDKSGKAVDVRIGLVPVQIGVGFFMPEPAKKATFVPAFLQEMANTVSGRDVSPVRVLAATLVFLLLLVSITVLLYSAVRSSIISIGRNPLSAAAVRKSLLEVGLAVFVILLFASGLIYLILKF